MKIPQKLMSHRLNKLLVPQLLLVAFAGAQLVACSSAPTKDDNQVAEQQKKAEIELRAEQMGMSVETVQAFQDAIEELGKPEPDLEKTEGLLKSVVAAEPDFAEAHYNLGVLYSTQNRYDEAVTHIETARSIAPGELSHTVALAQAYAVTEQYTKAQNLLEEVIARQPTNLTAKNNLAVLALKAGDDEKAMEYVRDVLKEDNENVGALNSLGLIYVKRENASLAKYVFTKAIKLAEKKPDPDIHNNLGMVYMAEDEVAQGVKQFEAANKVDPNYLESRLNLGSILIEYLDYERAATQFEEAVRISPNNCVAHLGHAASSFGLGKAEEAQKGFVFYVENCDADHVSSFERLAKLNETKLNNPAKAAEYYEKLMTLVDDEKKKAGYKAMAGFLKNQAEKSDQKEAAPVEDEQAPEDDAQAPEADDADGEQAPAEDAAE
ncbi:tetratricopeptide repeat protein [Bradymonas sediminis]|nr:tetratricopeptide repeat protein [Bradymonas sediminis]